jgi:hypothetical protein
MYAESLQRASVVNILSAIAIGKCPNESDLRAVPWSDLADCLEYHGVLGRVANILETWPKWPERRLFESEVRRRIMNHRARTVAQVERVRSLFRGHPISPVVIKGPTTAALFDTAYRMRWSTDIDLFVVDATLKQMVHNAEVQMVESKSEHEFGLLRAGDTIFDLHRYYPAFSYRKDVEGPVSHGDVFSCLCKDTAMYRRTIDSEVVMDSAVCVTSGWAEGVRFVHPSIAAVIAACHLFNSSQYAASFPRIRLSEILDYLELRRHSDFDNQLFDSIVEKTQAHDAIQFLERFVEEILTSCGSRESCGFLQDLWPGLAMDGFVFRIGSKSYWQNLLCRHVEMDSILAATGSTELQSCEGKPQWAQVRPCRLGWREGQIASHVIGDGADLDVSVSAVRHDNGLRIYMAACPASFDGAAFLVLLGNLYFEVLYENGECYINAQQQWKAWLQEDYELRVTDTRRGGLEFTLNIPWPIVLSVTSGRMIPGLLGARTWPTTSTARSGHLFGIRIKL